MKVDNRFNRLNDISSSLLLITSFGIVARIIYWAAYPLNWKLHAVFNVFELGTVTYLSNFSGYKPGRMPFFDAFSAVFYVPFSQLVGVKALVIFNLVITFAAIPAFYIAISRLFSSNVATPATLLFALYPKYIVLTSAGLPEAAAVSFLALTLYGLTTAQNSRKLTHYFFTGVLATLSYLMFVPAVAAGILIAVFIYLSGIKDRSKKTSFWIMLLPNRELLSFSVSPGSVGMLYLLFGPASRVAGGLSEGKLSVFTNPESYSLFEKIFWYNAYSFFDFWWHTRGFDRERGIEALINSLQGFLGSLFPVYLFGWAGITLILTSLIVAGISAWLYRRRSVDLLFISWIVAYILLWNYKNLGWTGGFQTRHVFPIFPAFCIAFGVGIYTIQKASRGINHSHIDWIQKTTVVSVAIMLCLSILFVNGAVQGTIENQKIQEDVVEPTQDIVNIVENESVAVVWPRNQRNIVLYSQNTLRPVILAGSTEQRNALDARHGETSTRQIASHPELCDADADYLYLQVEPEVIGRWPYTIQMNESRVDRLLTEHELVYQKTISASSFRTTNVEIYLLRLQCGYTGD